MSAERGLDAPVAKMETNYFGKTIACKSNSLASKALSNSTHCFLILVWQGVGRMLFNEAFAVRLGY